jgi:hypothetical protein
MQPLCLVRLVGLRGRLGGQRLVERLRHARPAGNTPRLTAHLPQRAGVAPLQEIGLDALPRPRQRHGLVTEVELALPPLAAQCQHLAQLPAREHRRPRRHLRIECLLLPLGLDALTANREAGDADSHGQHHQRGHLPQQPRTELQLTVSGA